MKNKSRFFDFLTIVVCTIYILAGILVSLNRFWQYEIFYYDFGIFDRAIWLVSRFQPPIIDHLVVSGKWIFADHLNPSIFLLSPLYWISQRQEIILIAQAVIVGVSGLVLYRIGLDQLKNRFLAFAIMISYFLFVGLQNAIISDFHEVTVSVLTLVLVFWAILKDRKKLFLLFFLITLGFKESTFLLGMGIAFFIFSSKKSWQKFSIIAFILSCFWGILSTKFIIPYFSGGIYQYSAELPLSFDIITRFFDNELKRKTLFYSFGSFGFLPLFSPTVWILIIQDFSMRFLPLNAFTRWGLGLHYSSQLAVILGIGSILTLKRITKFIKAKSPLMIFVGFLLILNSIFLHQFILRGPLGLAYNPAFYKHTRDFEFLDKIVALVPKDASVMTQNNLAVRFTHQKVWFLRPDYKLYMPDYILLDTREGQNPNNFFGTDLSVDYVAKLKLDRNYDLIYKTSEQFVFKKVKNQP